MKNYLKMLTNPYLLEKMLSAGIFPEMDFVCVEVLQPSQPKGVMSSMVSLPNQTFTGQA